MALSRRLTAACSSRCASPRIERQTGRDFQAELEALSLGLRAHPLDSLLQHRPDFDRLSRQRRLPRFQPRQLQQLRHHLHQPVDLGVRARQEVLRDGLVLEGAGLQRLDDGLDGGKRRPQLVRDVGDEVAARVLDALRLGDVVEDDERDPIAAAGDRGRGDLEEASLRPLDDEALPFARLASVAQRLDNLVFRHDPDEGVADGFLRAALKQRSDGAAGEGDAPFGVDGQDGVAAAIEDGRETAALLGDGVDKTLRRSGPSG